MALKLFGRNKSNGRAATLTPSKARGDGAHPAQRKREFVPAPQPSWADDEFKRIIQQGRHNVLLARQEELAQHEQRDELLDLAQRQLENRMALVPLGSVSLPTTLSDEPGAAEMDVDVAPFLLDIHAVTNGRYQAFVDAGGYDELDYWPEEIWPHLIELKDLTGQPGPRYWRNGRHDARFANHPVVAVSWYEAQAYSLWIGQRLPTEAEWQMAACWHIKSSADLMRRFPWGDAMDSARCNIWISRKGETVPVNEYPSGAAPNQILQLIGNAWEWTDSEYAITDEEGRPIVGEMPMRSVRGGSFDTYFETQATACFRTGQIALARANNTGFRCAMDLVQATWINGG